MVYKADYDLELSKNKWQLKGKRIDQYMFLNCDLELSKNYWQLKGKRIDQYIFFNCFRCTCGIILSWCSCKGQLLQTTLIISEKMLT